MSLHVREANQVDWPALAKVYDRAYRQAFGPDSLPEDVLTHLIPQIVEEELWLAEESGMILGFISLYWPDHFVRHFYVDPVVQGRGIGTRLFKHIDHLTAGDFSLKCDVANSKARRYYEGKGMSVIDRGIAETGEWLHYQSLKGTKPSKNTYLLAGDKG